MKTLSSFTTICRSRPWPIARSRCCCAVRPGREAYPGDVFYLHSRLLERSARVNEEYVEMVSKGAVKGKTGSLTGSAHHRDAGGRRHGVRADERHLDHRRTDLRRNRPVQRRYPSRDERRYLGVARRWRRADRHHQEAGRRYSSRARAVSRAGRVLAVRVRPRRSDPQAARARSAYDRGDEAEAVRPHVGRRDGSDASTPSTTASWTRSN